MFAGLMKSKGRIELVDAPEPQLEQPGEIIFQPEWTCLCGSDLPYFDSDFDAEEAEYPRQLGHSLHEMIGTVTGTSGTKFKVGERVLAVPVNQVGFFERFRLSENRAIHIDTRVPVEQALMAQPLGTVIYGIKKLPRVLDLDIAVVGQGPIGHLFNLALSNLGAREIIGIDPIASRLNLSAKTGATATVCNADQDAVGEVLKITRGAMPDIVVEAVGHGAQCINLCIELSRHLGQILYFGVPPSRLNDVRWGDLFRKNLTIYTSVNPDFSRDFPLAMRWIGEGRVDVSPLITHRYKVEDIQEAFETFHQRREGALKVLVEFPAARKNG